MGFFDRDPLTYFARPRFQLRIEYVALILEVAGVLAALGNLVFLIGKLRKAPTSFLLRGLLAVTIFVSIFMIAHFFLLYISFSPAALTVTTWGCTVAQVLIISVETESIKIFVFNLPDWIIYTLRGINALLAVALGLPQLFHGPIFMNPADPGFFTTWYSATSRWWSAYIGLYDFGICLFIAYEIYVVSRKSMYNLHGASNIGMTATTKTATNAASGASATVLGTSGPLSPPPSNQANQDFVRIKAGFQAQVRDTIIALVFFFIFIVTGIVFTSVAISYPVNLSMENLLNRAAYSQLAVACSGPHVAFISLMLNNVAQLVRASHGQPSGSHRKTRAGKRAKQSESSDRDEDPAGSVGVRK
ncbi:hypothetical protein HK105_206620 [Polyrhizophydium stewartii]|uniref:Uncharacterized protein n=1 Tax=Polyrhizophydium stewartii TaxID=2732419 RepID=A0ABR4N2Y6_9FUNG